jgi:hypothetical protein
MKRRDIIFLAVIGIGIVTLLGSCSSAGAGEDGGGGGAPESPTDLGDPTEPGGELLDEELNELLVAEEEGGSFTIHVRDRATGDAITEDVTVNVQNGTATAVDANGVFTVTPTSDDILRLQVLVPGYTVYTYTDYDSGTGINYVEKEPLDSRVFGEWILYKVVDASTQEEYAVYDESVTFRPDGSVSWEGARVYGNPDYYYSTVPAENGNVGFGQTSSIEWVSLNSSPSRPEFYLHVGLLRYNADDDILSMFAIGPTAPNVRLYYSRDELDPDDDNPTSEVGSGSFTFQGTTYEGLAARTDFLDSWTIVPTDGAYIGFTVLGVPSTDGTSTIADDGLLATFTTASGTQYVAGSGSATRSGDNLTFSFEMFQGTTTGPAAGSLTGQMTAPEADTIAIPQAES